MLGFLLLIGFVYIAGTIIYLTLLAVFGLYVKQRAAADKLYRFNIIIPAHNEEAVIASLINSIQQAIYPAEKLSITLVADFCDDNTANVARQMDCNVIERNSGERGKSAAVSQTIQQIRPQMQDDEVILIFDADNIVDADFFEQMNRCLALGADVVQGNTGIFNWSDTVFTKLNHVNFAVTNRFKELARSQAGLTCRLRGHGMAFTTKAIDAISWDASSLVEDQELTLKFILAGFRVQWVHQAHVDSVIPATAAEARVQRQRWAGGKSEVTKNAVARLFSAAIKTRSFIAADLAVDYMMVSYAVQLAIAGMGLLGAAIVLGIDHWLTAGFCVVTVTYFVYYLVAAILEGISFGTFLCFFTAPVFILWRVWIFLVSMRGAKAWH